MELEEKDHILPETSQLSHFGYYSCKTTELPLYPFHVPRLPRHPPVHLMTAALTSWLRLSGYWLR
ncbi:unnamed protein product [Haemonchus placei]|uniref:Uncharacterized protein n=1 Tax=Haemonchus placei TaxID=6290 RepID=A0A3P7VXH9_HAEPC|nr:unnamed protein product [Haemonchus placei]